mmetsp:Transcript_1361/g.3626  ORF Transcript_1361/g.3626 Transcript_1361/m.3626 type:complete len:1324 (+) Transcript_1361:48-4019(+)|eukprot:CAMPEP_0119132544 /NCGR_PEP_ID=MMETSP1310-20130426/11890_1 /TAXON_ID=464262 /ORGANISM="Genus nov. species nov., Strain RCC2339" /LENGTH=1323 /DNA_ID=CAMNT_0007123181 /DNA_START=60 /DNA_END=4031 /DNA_ORIENTATION=+
MGGINVVLILGLSFLSCSLVLGQILSDANDLADQVEAIANELGAQHDVLQQLYDREIFTDEEDNGLVLAAGLASQIETLLRAKNDHLRAMGDFVVSRYRQLQGFSGDPTELTAYQSMVGVSGFGFSSGYGNRTVSFVNSTVARPPDSHKRDEDEDEEDLLIEATRGLDDYFVDQFGEDGSNVVYQYFGGHTGMLRSFPGMEWARESDATSDYVPYDSRANPWYTRAVSTTKSLKIVVDHSSRTVEYADIMYETLETLVLGLSANDYVSISYAEGNGVITEHPDFGRSLVRGTEENKLRLLNFAATERDLAAAGSTSGDDPNFDQAIRLANEDVASALNRQECERAIVFLTATKIKRDQLIDFVEQPYRVENLRYFTYGWGEGPTILLRSLACRTDGVFVDANSEPAPRWAAKMYEVLANGRDLTEVYWEANLGYAPQAGFGLVLSGSLPVVVEDISDPDLPDRIIGVVGLDYLFVPIQDIYVNFRRGISFAMFITEQADSLLHVNDREPRSVVVSENSPMYHDISLIEPSTEFATDVRPQVIEEVNGQVKVVVERELPRGDIDEDGTSFRLETTEVIFAWQRLTGFPFAVLTSLATRDVDVRRFEASEGWIQTSWVRADLLEGSNLLPPGFDFSPSEIYVGDLTLQYSTFKVPPRAFINSTLFNENEYESVAFAERVHSYLNNIRLVPNGDNQNGNLGIFRSAKDNIHITSKVLPAWQDALFGGVIPNKFDFEDAELAVQVYVGLQDGAFRGYPGLFDYGGHLYDPTTRPWYAAALANLRSDESVASLSIPYEDAFGAGKLITISEPLLSSTVEESRNKQFIGAVGADLLYSAIVDTLIGPVAGGTCDDGEGLVPTSTQCYLIDTSALYVIHPSFLNADFNTIAQTRSLQTFVGVLQPELAEQLETIGFLERQVLERYDQGVNVVAWVTNEEVLDDQQGVISGTLTAGVRDGRRYCSSGNWELTRVARSNVYLVIITNYDADLSDDCYQFDTPARTDISYDPVFEAEKTTDGTYERLLLPCPRIIETDVSKLDLDYFRAENAHCNYDWRELDYVEWGDWPSIVIVVITVFLLFYMALVCAGMIFYRGHAIMFMSSLSFLFINMFGCFIGLVAVIVMVGEPNPARCMSAMWMLFYAFCFVYSTVFVRTYRTYLIFDPKNPGEMKLQVVSDKELLMIMGLFFIVPTIILIVWSAVDPLKDTIVDDHNDDDHKLLYICDCDNYGVYLGLLIGYCGVLLLAGALMSFYTRNASIPIGDYKFKESRYLAFVIYNLLLCIGVFVPLVSLLDGDPEITLLLTAVAIWTVTVGTISLLFLPKIVIAFRRPE